MLFRSYRNIQLYLDARETLGDETVIALSSGFMTYPGDAHPAYAAASPGSISRAIVSNPRTVALFPSFDYEICVTETVRRQLTRPFSRSADREEQVIRARFVVYWRLPTTKVETARPVDAVVDDLVMHLMHGTGLQSRAAKDSHSFVRDASQRTRTRGWSWRCTPNRLSS